MDGISPQQEEQIRELIDQRRMIDAIKLYREVTGVGLKEAKDAVTEMWHGKPLQAPLIPSESEDDTLLEGQIKQLLRKRQKIEAVKIYREAHNCGLKDAKDAVDAIEAQMRRENRASLPASTDPFAEDTQRNRNFLIFALAFILLVIGGLAFFFLAGNGF